MQVSLFLIVRLNIVSPAFQLEARLLCFSKFPLWTVSCNLYFGKRVRRRIEYFVRYILILSFVSNKFKTKRVGNDNNTSGRGDPLFLWIILKTRLTVTSAEKNQFPRCLWIRIIDMRATRCCASSQSSYYQKRRTSCFFIRHRIRTINLQLTTALFLVSHDSIYHSINRRNNRSFWIRQKFFYHRFSRSTPRCLPSL